MNNFTKYVKVNYKKIKDLRIKNNITQKQMAEPAIDYLFSPILPSSSGALLRFFLEIP